MKRREQKSRRAPLPTADRHSLWKARAFGGTTCAVLMTLANYQEFPLPTVEINGAIHFTWVPTGTAVTSQRESVALHWLSVFTPAAGLVHMQTQAQLALAGCHICSSAPVHTGPHTPSLPRGWQLGKKLLEKQRYR